MGPGSYAFTITVNARRSLPEKNTRNLGGLVQPSRNSFRNSAVGESALSTAV